jgi:hypothetical protein
MVNLAVDPQACVSADTAGAVVASIRRSTSGTIEVSSSTALDVLNALLDSLRTHGVPDISDLRSVLSSTIATQQIYAVITELPRVMIEGKAPEFDAYAAEFGVTPSAMPLPNVSTTKYESQGSTKTHSASTTAPSRPFLPSHTLSTSSRILGGIGLFLLIMTAVYKVSR